MTVENLMWVFIGMAISAVILVPVMYYVVIEERRRMKQEIDDVYLSIGEDDV